MQTERRTGSCLSRAEFDGDSSDLCQQVGLAGMATGTPLDAPVSYGYKGQMKTATVTEAKNSLSALIDRVKSGETVTILDRGTPVARLEPVVTHADQDGRLLRLSRSGIIRMPMSDEYRALASSSSAPSANTSVVEALLDERRSGR